MILSHDEIIHKIINLEFFYCKNYVRVKGIIFFENYEKYQQKGRRLSKYTETRL
jgi:predicted secreted protein